MYACIYALMYMYVNDRMYVFVYLFIVLFSYLYLFIYLRFFIYCAYLFIHPPQIISVIHVSASWPCVSPTDLTQQCQSIKEDRPTYRRLQLKKKSISQIPPA